eukprot:s2518_g15.t1
MSTRPNSVFAAWCGQRALCTLMAANKAVSLQVLTFADSMPADVFCIAFGLLEIGCTFAFPPLRGTKQHRESPPPYLCSSQQTKCIGVECIGVNCWQLQVGWRTGADFALMTRMMRLPSALGTRQATNSFSHQLSGAVFR